MAEYTFTIEGMHCSGCENLVVQEISAISGIEDVEADNESGRLVIHGEQNTKERVRQTIANLGYKPTE